LLPTLGSAGDVNPVIGLGLALQSRGHRATVLTNPYFADLIKRQGLGFLPVGTLEDAQQAFSYAHLWHPRKGAEHIMRIMIAPIRQIYHLIETHADSDTVVAASGISLGARVAQERLGVPMASVHLQPSLIRSYIDQGKVVNLRIAAWQPMWFKRAFYWLADRTILDRIVGPPLNEFRATLGLRPVNRLFDEWIQSTQCVIGLFPDWFAAPQPDWPPHTQLVGFPLWDDGDGKQPLTPEALEFLAEGEPPVVFTPGSAGATMQRFFRESVSAAARLGVRAMLVTNHPQQLPSRLPAGVCAFGYLPFSALLPRIALLVHHGGVGTMAQCIKAGVPQLVVPNAFDQFDNAWRVERLGLGGSLSQARYRSTRVTRMIRAMLDDRVLLQRCQGWSTRMNGEAAVRRACEFIEALHRGSAP
jgi:rhamnosyltransferase subunit B